MNFIKNNWHKILASILPIFIVSSVYAATKLFVPQGGTSVDSFPANSLIISGTTQTGALSATSSPTIGWIYGTSTHPSILAGELNIPFFMATSTTASSTVVNRFNVSGVLNASSTLLVGTGLTVYSGNSVLAGGATITCTGCLTDVNVADIALGGGTSGNYVRTIADSGNSTITVANSGAEDADVTLNVIDVNCTDCLGATEIADVYILNNADDSTTGKLTIAGGLIGQASSTFSSGLIIAGSPLQASSTLLAQNITAYASSTFASSLNVGGAFTCTGCVTNADLANSSLTVTAGTGLTDGGAISLGSSATLNVGAGTCITVNANDVAVTTNCTDATTLDSIEGASLLRSDASDSYTSGTLTFDASTILDLTAASLRIPNAANPTVTTLGYMALDTTNNELLMATSTTGGAVVYAKEIKQLYSFVLASTSPAFKNGETLPLPSKENGFTVYYIQCNVWGGTSVAANLTDSASNDATSATCDTTTSTQRAIVTGNSWTAGEGVALEVGAITGTPNYLIMSIWGIWTRR